MKGKWAQGIEPRNFAWVVKDKLAVCERPGGYGANHRRVRRQEEIIWIREQGFTCVISLIPSPHNLHNYDELGVTWRHRPFAAHDDEQKFVAGFFPELRAMLADGQKVLVHQDELGDRVSGLVAGFLLWSGMVDHGPHAISITEQLVHRQLGPLGRAARDDRAGAAEAGCERHGSSSAGSSRPGTAARCRRSSSGRSRWRSTSTSHLDLAAATHSDALDDTVDYGALCAMVERVIVTERFTLLERLAERRRRGRRWPTTARRRCRSRCASCDRRCRSNSRPPASISSGRDDRGHRGRAGASAGVARRSARTSAIAGARSARRSTRCPGWSPSPGCTRPIPSAGRPGQGPYLNLVVAIESDASPRQLLGMCHRIESAAGRVRGERWGPRTLDIDILWIDGETVDEPDLSIPHPRMFERRFVLVPLNDVAPDLLPPAGRTSTAGSRPVEPL